MTMSWQLTSILLLFEGHHWKYEVYNTAVSPPSFWRFLDRAPYKKFIRKPHGWNYVFCLMSSTAVWHETDVRICLGESYALPLSGLRSTVSVFCQQSLQRWQIPFFLFVNSQIIFCPITLLAQKVNENFIFFLALFVIVLHSSDMSMTSM